MGGEGGFEIMASFMNQIYINFSKNNTYHSYSSERASFSYDYYGLYEIISNNIVLMDGEMRKYSFQGLYTLIITEYKEGSEKIYTIQKV